MKKVYSKIESINGSVITVKAEDVSYGELAQVQTSFGASLAQVNKLDRGLVSLQVFAGGRGVSTGDEVRFLGREMQVSFSDDLLGRIFNGSGEPRDQGPMLKDNMVEIGGPSVNPAKRIMAKRMIRTGIPMIDVFNPTTNCSHASQCRLRLMSSYSAVWDLNTTTTSILRTRWKKRAR